MLESENLEALVIATPPVEHFDIVAAGIDNNLHIYCEKPFCLNTSEAVELCALSHKKKIYAVGFQFRFEVLIAKMKSLIASGVIGKTISIDFSWITSGRSDPGRSWSWQNDDSSGGGVINSFASHMIDLIYWLSGQSITSIVSMQKSILISERLDTRHIYRNVTAEDFVKAEFILGKDIKTSLEATNCSVNSTGMRITISGQNGILEYRSVFPFGPKEASLALVRSGSFNQEFSTEQLEIDYQGDSRLLSVGKIMSAFEESIISGYLSQDLPGFADGLAIHRVLDQMKSY